MLPLQCTHVLEYSTNCNFLYDLCARGCTCVRGCACVLDQLTPYGMHHDELVVMLASMLRSMHIHEAHFRFSLSFVDSRALMHTIVAVFTRPHPAAVNAHVPGYTRSHPVTPVVTPGHTRSQVWLHPDRYTLRHLRQP